MNLAEKLNRWPNKAGAALAAIYIASQTSIGLLLGHKVGAELVHMQLAFTKPRFDAIVSGWSVEHLSQFQNHFYLDFIHPVWYGLMLCWALAKTLPAKRQALVWMPVIAALCDMCENTLHAIPAFQGTFRALDQPIIALSSSFAATKWLLAALSVGFIVGEYFAGRRR